MVSPSPIIRAFQPADIDAVIPILQSVSNFVPSPPLSYDYLNGLIARESFFPFVATIDKLVVGFASLSLVYRIRGANTAVIEDLAVAADYRRQGIAQLLVDALLTRSADLGCFKVALTSSNEALRLYSKNGFTINGTAMSLLL